MALQRDPNYAPAYAGIAMAWAGLQQLAFVPPHEAGPQARAAVLRALELDSTLVELQYALAGVKTWVDWDWPAAEAAFRRAIELNPNFPDVRAYYSHFLCAMKRPDEAMEQMERAVELDPFNPLLQGLHGFLLYMVGRNEEALEQFRRLLRTVPNHPVALTGLVKVYEAKGTYEESLTAAQSYYTVIEFPQAAEALEQGYAEAGYRGAIRRAADVWAALSDMTYVPPAEIAELYALAGEYSQTLDWLERGFAVHDGNMPYLSVVLFSDRLRDEPRFQELLRRMNLP
jgi:serine/threonine-protein kinase